jgi:spermidine synthase
VPDFEAVDRSVKPYLAESPTATSLRFAGDQIQSQMWKHAPEALALDYTQTMMGFVLFQLAPARIGMIGLGGGSLVKFCHRNLPASAIEVVENSPQVLDLRQIFHVPPDDERLRVHLADGADHIACARADYDVLLLDAYDRVGIPPRLATLQFYLHCRRALRPNGLLVANIAHGQAQTVDPIERIRAVFGDSMLAVRDPEGCNDIVFAWTGVIDDRYLGDQGRPLEIRSAAWDHVIPGLDRVRFAWRDRIRIPPRPVMAARS